MAEVIAVATMRCLPSIHPIFKVTPYPFSPAPLLAPWHSATCAGISGFGESQPIKASEQGSENVLSFSAG